mmetsp:Transcript_28394/g.53089  ORF Transcript_28394/g.53089 Transcript_28394/m.53089 type:complete len:105 (+) Transcript_28394:7810-8124(+)
MASPDLNLATARRYEFMYFVEQRQVRKFKIVIMKLLWQVKNNFGGQICLRIQNSCRSLKSRSDIDTFLRNHEIANSLNSFDLDIIWGAERPPFLPACPSVSPLA